MEERRAITFDNKIPLTWLLSCAGTAFVLLITVLWFVAGQSIKLDSMAVQSEKRDAKLEVLIRDNYDARRNADILTMRVEALEKAKK